MDEKELKKLSEELNKSIDDIKKDIEAKATKEDIDAKFTEITDKFGDLVKSEDFTKQQEQLDSIATDIKGMKEKTVDTEKSFKGQIKDVLESDDFKNAIKGKGINYNFEVKANNITEALTITNDTTNDTRVIQEDRDAGIVYAPRPRLTTWDLVNKQATDSRVVQYVERTGETDGATMIGTDGGAGGQSDGSWEAKSVELTAISAYSKIHRDMLEDWSVVQAEMNEILNFDLAAKRNNQILTGTGSSNQLRGLIYTSNPWATAFNAPTQFEGAVDAANRFDAIRIAILQVMNGADTDYATGFNATGIVLHPNDAAWFDLIKDEDGNYILPPFTSANGTVIKNVPVIEDTFMTEGTFLVGDFQKANARIRRGIEIRVWEQNEDDALKNLITLTATHRLGFFVKAPYQKAFVYGTFTAAIAEIDKVTS